MMSRPAAALPTTLRAQPTGGGSIIARDPPLTRATAALQRTGILGNLRDIASCMALAPTDQASARQPQNPAQMLFPIANGPFGGSGIDPVLAPKVVNVHVVQPDTACGDGVIHKTDHVLVG
jgi:hypothetical protein